MKRTRPSWKRKQYGQWGSDTYKVHFLYDDEEARDNLATIAAQPVIFAVGVLAAFVFALTALTYQFQGWLAALMSNPRRRRTNTT